MAPGPWTPSQLDQCWTQHWESPFFCYLILLSFFFLPSIFLFFDDDDLNDGKVKAKYLPISMAFEILFPPWASIDLGAPFLSPAFWKFCIAQCRFLFVDTILLASVEYAGFLFINLHLCCILKKAIKIWKLSYFGVNFQAFLWDVFLQQQKALTSGGVMGGAYKALTHKEKSFWRSSSVQIANIAVSDFNMA